MQARDFCYWLQGYFELNADDITREGLTGGQMKKITKHLDMVFYHDIDKDGVSEEGQEALNHLHGTPIDGSNIIMRC